MSHLVLARKYRPRTFAEMTGQAHVVQALSNALASGRLHHAFLFTGTRGIGKTTVSRILAKSLNCVGVDGQGGITANPCGQCGPCTAIDEGRFVDYTELDAASNRGVDEVQALLEQAVYKPVQGRFKVFMIDEVHMLTNHAFNAMLKTLEEPPEYLKFVLATTDPQKVPVTVLSRCLQFNLRPMAPETVRAHLQKVLQAEGIASEPGALRLLSRAARGSMRDALSLTDQGIAFGAGRLLEGEVRRMIGATDRSVVFGLVQALADGDGARVVALIDDLRAQGHSADAVLEDMALLLQRMAVLQATGGVQAAGAAVSLRVGAGLDTDEGADEGADADAVQTARLAAQLPADETQLLYSICLHGRSEIGLAPDEYAGLVMTLLRLLAFKPAAGTAARVQGNTASAGAPVAGAEKKSPPDAGIESNRPVASIGSYQVAIKKEVSGAPPGGRLPVLEVPPPSTAIRPLPPSPKPSQVSPAATPAALASPTADPGTGLDQAEVLAMRVVEHAQMASPADDARAGAFVPVADGEFWFEVVQALVAAGALVGLAREMALQAQMVGRDNGHWLLRIERESLNHAGHRERLRQALSALGHEVVIGVEVGTVTDSPARRLARASAERLAAAEAVIRNDPFVQAMMREFGATIVPGSVAPL